MPDQDSKTPKPQRVKSSEKRLAAIVNAKAAAVRDRDIKALSVPQNLKEGIDVWKARTSRNLEISLEAPLGIIGEAIYNVRRADYGQRAMAVKMTFKSALIGGLSGRFNVIGEVLSSRLAQTIQYTDDPLEMAQKNRAINEAVVQELLNIHTNFQQIGTKFKDLQTILKSQEDNFKKSEREFRSMRSTFNKQNEHLKKISSGADKRLKDLHRNDKNIIANSEKAFTNIGKRIDDHEARIVALENSVPSDGGPRKGRKKKPRANVRQVNLSKRPSHPRKSPEMMLNKSTQVNTGFDKDLGIDPAATMNKANPRWRDGLLAHLTKSRGSSILGMLGDVAGAAGIARFAPMLMNPWVLGGTAVVGGSAYLYNRYKNSQTNIGSGSQQYRTAGMVRGGMYPGPRMNVNAFSQEDFNSMYDRRMNEENKKQFMMFGKMPGGFEFMQGNMGRLGSPAAVAARGAQPLGFGGSYSAPPGSFFPGVQGIGAPRTNYVPSPGGSTGNRGAPSPSGSRVGPVKSNYNKAQQAWGQSVGSNGPYGQVDPFVATGRAEPIMSSGKTLLGGANMPGNTSKETVDALNAIAAKHGLDPAAISQVIKLESGWDTRNSTGSYNGLTQIGAATFNEAGGRLGGMTYNQFRNGTPAQQIQVYSAWLDHYKVNQKAAGAGVDFTKMSSAQQAAFLQGVQFAPNKSEWYKAVASGNGNVRATTSPQARVLGSTSYSDMQKYYEGQMGKSPGKYAPPPGQKNFDSSGAFDSFGLGQSYPSRNSPTQPSLSGTITPRSQSQASPQSGKGTLIAFRGLQGQIDEKSVREIAKQKGMDVKFFNHTDEKGALEHIRNNPGAYETLGFSAGVHTQNRFIEGAKKAGLPLPSNAISVGQASSRGGTLPGNGGVPTQHFIDNSGRGLAGKSNTVNIGGGHMPSGTDKGVMAKVAERMGGGSSSETTTASQTNGAKNLPWTSLERAPTQKEIDSHLKSGQKYFDFDTKKEGGAQAAAYIASKGGEIADYNRGMGNAEWGEKPRSYEAMMNEAKASPGKFVHLDNFDRMSDSDKRRAIADLSDVGKTVIPKNATGFWNSYLKQNPEYASRIPYAVTENQTKGGDVQGVKELGERVKGGVVNMEWQKGSSAVTGAQAQRFSQASGATTYHMQGTEVPTGGQGGYHGPGATVFGSSGIRSATAPSNVLPQSSVQKTASSAPSMGYSLPGVDPTLQHKQVLKDAIIGKIPVTSKAVDQALQFEGMHERRDRQVLKDYIRKGGSGIDPASTPWCAAYVNASLASAGIKGSKSDIANSFQKWGDRVEAANVQRGDVAIQHRGLGPYQTGGHVGMATGNVKRDKDGKVTSIEMVSGNSSDMVRKTWHTPRELMLRRANQSQLPTQVQMTPEQQKYLESLQAAGDPEGALGASSLAANSKMFDARNVQADKRTAFFTTQTQTMVGQTVPPQAPNQLAQNTKQVNQMVASSPIQPGQPAVDMNTDGIGQGITPQTKSLDEQVASNTSQVSRDVAGPAPSSASIDEQVASNTAQVARDVAGVSPMPTSSGGGEETPPSAEPPSEPSGGGGSAAEPSGSGDGSPQASTSEDTEAPRGGGRHNPESEGESPGSGGYGNQGRCFV